MTGHHSECDRSEELRLTRAGCPNAEPVRTHSVLGGLFDIESYRCARTRCADRNPKPIAGAPAAPALSRHIASNIIDPNEILPPHAAARRSRERIHTAGPIPGQPLRARQRGGVTHLIRARENFFVA